MGGGDLEVAHARVGFPEERVRGQADFGGTGEEGLNAAVDGAVLWIGADDSDDLVALGEKVVGGDKREDARVEQHRRPEPAQQVERRAEVEEEALEEAPAGAEGGPLRGPGLFLFLFVSRSGRGLMSEAKGEQ